MLSHHGGGGGHLDPGGHHAALRAGDAAERAQMEVKPQFMTREGLYVLMPLSEYSRPNRVGSAEGMGPGGMHAAAAGGYGPASAAMAGGGMSFGGAGGAGGGGVAAAAVAGGSGPGGGGGGAPPPVRMSFCLASSSGSATPSSSASSSLRRNGDFPSNASRDSSSSSSCDHRIVFNSGKELYVYPYRGVRKAVDLNKPLDKRAYKGTFPSCHDFYHSPASPSSPSSSPLHQRGLNQGDGGLANGNGSGAEEPPVANSPMLIGFSLGQIQLLDSTRKDGSKLFNEEVS